jgi:hypothetical protein
LEIKPSGNYPFVRFHSSKDVVNDYDGDDDYGNNNNNNADPD